MSHTPIAVNLHCTWAYLFVSFTFLSYKSEWVCYHLGVSLFGTQDISLGYWYFCHDFDHKRKEITLTKMTVLSSFTNPMLFQPWICFYLPWTTKWECFHPCKKKKMDGNLYCQASKWQTFTIKVIHATLYYTSILYIIHLQVYYTSHSFTCSKFIYACIFQLNYYCNWYIF